MKSYVEDLLLSWQAGKFTPREVRFEIVRSRILPSSRHKVKLTASESAVGSHLDSMLWLYLTADDIPFLLEVINQKLTYKEANRRLGDYAFGERHRRRGAEIIANPELDQYYITDFFKLELRVERENREITGDEVRGVVKNLLFEWQKGNLSPMDVRVEAESIDEKWLDDYPPYIARYDPEMPYDSDIIPILILATLDMMLWDRVTVSDVPILVDVLDTPLNPSAQRDAIERLDLHFSSERDEARVEEILSDPILKHYYSLP